ncbi:hypothetical protein CLOM_g16736 [Closterium sp. NIES-68]|nr:hypothetical protein CLOM_g16736 [Closterium sp. NIES-68]
MAIVVCSMALWAYQQVSWGAYLTKGAATLTRSSLTPRPSECDPPGCPLTGTLRRRLQNAALRIKRGWEWERGVSSSDAASTGLTESNSASRRGKRVENDSQGRGREERDERAIKQEGKDVPVHESIGALGGGSAPLTNPVSVTGQEKPLLNGGAGDARTYPVGDDTGDTALTSTSGAGGEGLGQLKSATGGVGLRRLKSGTGGGGDAPLALSASDVKQLQHAGSSRCEISEVQE